MSARKGARPFQSPAIVPGSVHTIQTFPNNQIKHFSSPVMMSSPVLNPGGNQVMPTSTMNMMPGGGMMRGAVCTSAASVHHTQTYGNMVKDQHNVHPSPRPSSHVACCAFCQNMQNKNHADHGLHPPAVHPAYVPVPKYQHLGLDNSNPIVIDDDDDDDDSAKNDGNNPQSQGQDATSNISSTNDHLESKPSMNELSKNVQVKSQGSQHDGRTNNSLDLQVIGERRGVLPGGIKVSPSKRMLQKSPRKMQALGHSGIGGSPPTKQALITSMLPNAEKMPESSTMEAAGSTPASSVPRHVHAPDRQRAKMSAPGTPKSPIKSMSESSPTVSTTTPPRIPQAAIPPFSVNLSNHKMNRTTRNTRGKNVVISDSSSSSTTSEHSSEHSEPPSPVDTQNQIVSRAKDIAILLKPEILKELYEEAITQRPTKKLRISPRNLYMACKSYDYKKVVALLVDGCNPTQPVAKEKMKTAMHAAAAGGFVDLIHILNIAGASYESPDEDQRTPLFDAVENNRLAAVKHLIKAGCNLLALDSNGMSVLQMAAWKGHLGIIRLLLATGKFNCNHQDTGGWTAIMWAAEDRHEKTVEFLIEHGANVHIRDHELNICLHWSAYSGLAEISDILLRANSDINCINRHGDTPLHIATRENNFNCVQLYLMRNANMNIRNNDNLYPIDMAVQNSKCFHVLHTKKQMMACQLASGIRRVKVLSSDISRGLEKIALPCLNEVDDEPAPLDFVFIMESCLSNVSVDYDIQRIQGCICEEDCRNSMHCSCAQLSDEGKLWYSKDGTLNTEIHELDRPLVFECGKKCKCWGYCRNRVIQKGVRYPLQLFRTYSKGWGVRTAAFIPQGGFVCEYVGELISDAEADSREDDTYLFDLDMKENESELYCIDARYYGNISRFINHSCEPNITPIRFFVDHQDVRFPRIAFFALRDMAPMEEICFDYGDRFWEVKYKEFSCLCGTAKCQYPPQV